MLSFGKHSFNTFTFEMNRKVTQQNASYARDLADSCFVINSVELKQSVKQSI
jgi:hypothetical protein